MSDDMLGRAVRLIVELAKISREALGAICDLLERLCSARGQEHLVQFKQFLRGELEPILQFLGTITIPATTEKFVAQEKFVIDKSDKVKVKIAWTGNNFQDLIRGVVENPQAESKLYRHRLTKASVDKFIFAELGEQSQAETNFTTLFALLEKQGHGQPKEDGLIVDGSANILYIAGRAVHAHWDSDGWGLGAGSVEDPDEWSAGFQVFSRNYCFSPVSLAGVLFRRPFRQPPSIRPIS